MDGSPTLWAGRGNDYGRYGAKERYDATWIEEPTSLQVGTYDYDKPTARCLEQVESVVPAFGNVTCRKILDEDGNCPRHN